MSPYEIATLEIFSLNSVEFVTCQHIFEFLGGFAPDPTRGSVPVWTPLLTEPTLLSPSETNSWLRLCLALFLSARALNAAGAICLIHSL